MANKIFNALFEVVVTIQVLCMLVFILREYNHLDNIRYHYDPGQGAPIIDFTINFYAILVLVAAIFVIVIIASLNILGSGLGDAGSRSILRLVSFVMLFAVLTIGTSYYMQALGGVFMGIWTVFASLAYILYLANTNTEVPV